MKKYPIGIQTFSKIREEDFFYVDKTPWVHKLEAEKSGYYFLSRPRRFGKSLFVDTLRQAFLGKKEYFKGLFLENNWDWSQTYPVLKMSWGAGVLKSPDELKITFQHQIKEWLRQYSDIQLESTTEKEQFKELFEILHVNTGQKVVILIDEYDKPILDNITNITVAQAMREELKNLYSVVKDADEHIKLAFITGVSKFSKVSLFSGLNNLKDISQSPGYGAICGYTQEELEKVFAPALKGLDLAEIKHWYNGYHFAEAEGVYNPFDVLLFLDSREYKNYWFESATPTFLIEMMAKQQYAVPDLENISAGAEVFGSFEIEDLSLDTLLYQAGYLTVASTSQFGSDIGYNLCYPNFEVKKSLSDFILTYLIKRKDEKIPNRQQLWEILQAPDFPRFTEVFQSFFASIPEEWYRKNYMEKYEGYYASIFYCYFTALGLDTRPEERTNHGRMDMSVLMDHAVFVFEFKVVDLIADPNPALEQIKKKNYHQKYLSLGKPIYLVGVEFNAAERNVVRVEWEVAVMHK
jgi:hypothetical protein